MPLAAAARHPAKPRLAANKGGRVGAAAPAGVLVRMMTPTEPITVTISHRLGRDEAKRRLDRGIGEIRSQLGALVKTLDHSWDGYRLDFSASAVMQTITGRIDVHEEFIRVELMLPGFLRLAGKAIAGRIQRTSAALLEGPKKKP